MNYKIVTWNIEKKALSLLAPILLSEGITMEEAADYDTLLSMAKKESFHMILADVFTSPDMATGLSLIEDLRKACTLPLFIFTKKEDLCTQITALDFGADEIVCSIINPLELRSRILALLRRFYRFPGYQEKETKVYTVRNLELNDVSKKTFVDGEEKQLTPIEYRILKLLISKQGKPVSSQEIYKTIWKMNAVDTDNIIAVHMRHIRKKIEHHPDNPSYLKVVRGIGYMIV